MKKGKLFFIIGIFILISCFFVLAKNIINFDNNGFEKNLINPEASNLQQSGILIINPVYGVFDKSRVNIDLIVSEPCNLGYIDYTFNFWEVLNRGGFDNFTNFTGIKSGSLCTNCQIYNKTKSFKDGAHLLTVQCLDKPISASVPFLVDTKKISIQTTEPKRNKFTNGSSFIIKYSEENPWLFILSINGIPMAMKSSPRPGGTPETCPVGKNQVCEFSMDLSLFNNQTINYVFSIFDAGAKQLDSKPVQVTVDTIPPVIGNVVYSSSANSVKVNVSIAENNFAALLYKDNNASSPSWKTFCSSLRNNACSRVLIFRGTHNLELQAIDLAGNSAVKNVTITN